MTTFAVGSLVAARGREWVVLPDSSDDFLVLQKSCFILIERFPEILNTFIIFHFYFRFLPCLTCLILC